MERSPMERLGHESEPDSDGSSIVVRIGFIVAGGVLAAVTSSIPAALRSGEGGAGRALETYVVVSALATPIGVAAVAVLRRARVGLRFLTGERHAHLVAIGVLWWSVIELALLAVAGAVLRKTTHHHALAGVTFAAFALVSGVLVGIFARRATAIIARGGSSLQRMGLAIASGAAFLVVMLVGLRTSRAEGLHTAGALVDAFALTVTSMIASSRMFARLRPMAFAGVPVAVLVLLIGFTTLRFDPKLRESLVHIAPIHGLVIELFGG